MKHINYKNKNPNQKCYINNEQYRADFFCYLRNYLSYYGSVTKSNHNHIIVEFKLYVFNMCLSLFNDH